MFGNTFYYGFMRRFVALFGTLFNNITIERPYGDPVTIQSFKVPITYASQDKMLARLNSNPELNRKVAAVSPAISFEVGTPRFDPERNLQPTLKRCMTNGDGDRITQFVAVPYNLDFKLHIYSKQEEDGLRVLEQILPFFRPSLVVTVKVMPDMNYKIDIPIVLNSVDVDNSSVGEYMDRRQIIWTLDFTMKAEFAGPIDDTGRGLIKKVHVNMRDFTNRAIIEEVHVEPGLTANGEPTSIRDDSIDISLINADDDYGYITEILDGPEPHDE